MEKVKGDIISSGKRYFFSIFIHSHNLVKITFLTLERVIQKPNVLIAAAGNIYVDG